VLVLGHTKCGAVYGATKTFLDAQAQPKKAGSAGSALQGLLQDLGAVAHQAQEEMGADAEEDAIAAHAVRVNVFHTVNFLLKFSDSIREGVRSGQIQIEAGIYHLETGSVEFLGESPQQAELLESTLPVPPSMAGQEADRGMHGVRTGADGIIKSSAALKLLKEGNERFAAGAPVASVTSSSMRRALAKCGQAPHSAIVGSADSRVPIDTLFDAMPGDLFVLRNAGNTCTHAEGSIVGSLEFCTGKLGTQLILVLGHTHCGAVAGATRTYRSGATERAPGSALEGLLHGLAGVAKRASEDLGPSAQEANVVAHAVKVNVFNSMNFLIKFSEPIRELVRKGDLDIQGGIYHLETGRVEFLGRSPQQKELLSSKWCVPPSITSGAVRTSKSAIVPPQDALAMLRDGNERFAVGAPVAGKLHKSMREALASVGQAPHTAVVSSSDSRVPLETIFDALPGDLFVLRNAGNTCTHAEGSVLGSLEFCTGPLNTCLIFVLGHTNCGAIKGATRAFLQSQKANAAKDGHALDAMLRALGSVVESAAMELGKEATEDEIAQHAVKLNVFTTMNFMLQHSEPIRQKVKSGDLEVHGGIYDLASGRVQFLGQSPSQMKLLKLPPPLTPGAPGISPKDRLLGA